MDEGENNETKKKIRNKQQYKSLKSIKDNSDIKRGN
jgi:hypothetical protein